MTTWHDRLQTALTARKKDWPDLFKKSGLKKSSVYAWKPDATDRTRMMTGDNAATVCDFLKINVMWLFHGTGPSGLEENQESGKKATSTATGKIFQIAENTPPEYHLSAAEKTLIKGYQLAGEETRDILLQSAQAVINRFSERSEKND